MELETITARQVGSVRSGEEESHFPGTNASPNREPATLQSSVEMSVNALLDVCEWNTILPKQRTHTHLGSKKHAVYCAHPRALACN